MEMHVFELTFEVSAGIKMNVINCYSGDNVIWTLVKKPYQQPVVRRAVNVSGGYMTIAKRGLRNTQGN